MSLSRGSDGDSAATSSNPSSKETSDLENESPQSINFQSSNLGTKEIPQSTKTKFQPVNDTKESGVADLTWTTSFSPSPTMFKTTSTPKRECERPVSRNTVRHELSSIYGDDESDSSETMGSRKSSSSSLSLSDVSEIANDTPEMKRKRYENLFCPEVQEKEGVKEKKRLLVELTTEMKRNFKIYPLTVKEWDQQRLEDEKDKVVSTLKKDMIVQELSILDQDATPDDSVNVSCVTISNIKYHITVPPKHRYYFCVLTHKATVLASQIVSGSTSRDIAFEDDFKFTNLDNDFKIHMMLYQITFPSRRKNFLPWLLSLVKIRRDAKLPIKFEPVDVTAITLSNIYRGQLTTEHVMPPDGKALISAKVTGKLGLIPNLFSGFVEFAPTRMNRRVVMTKKWCVVEQTALKIRNSPEEDQPEVLSIDILSDINFRRATQRECSRKNTLILTNGGCSSEPVSSYFVRAVTDEDHHCLLRAIELAACVAKRNETIMAKST